MRIATIAIKAVFPYFAKKASDLLRDSSYVPLLFCLPFLFFLFLLFSVLCVLPLLLGLCFCCFPIYGSSYNVAKLQKISQILKYIVLFFNFCLFLSDYCIKKGRSFVWNDLFYCCLNLYYCSTTFFVTMPSAVTILMMYIPFCNGK